MSRILTSRSLQLRGGLLLSLQNALEANNYATGTTRGSMKKPGKKQGITMEKKVLPVEKDVHKLLAYVCGSNICKDGEDVKLKPDSEYPEWLWSIRTEKRRLEDLDPDTKEYWRFVRKEALRRKNRQREGTKQ
ncbi:hypothetical protein KM043_000504 [Ampulex compressa]|nr:hypothetical protein KM043_000504 [Ampulex compressa]